MKHGRNQQFLPLYDGEIKDKKDYMDNRYSFWYNENNSISEGMNMWVKKWKAVTSILLVVALLASPAIPVGAADAENAVETISTEAFETFETAEETDLAETGADIETAATGENAPTITQVLTVSGGHKIIWSAYPNAAIYRLFMKNTSGSGKAWIKIADTTDTRYIHRNLTEGTTYIYTVRAMNWMNEYISGFDAVGYAFTYYPAPVLKSTECVYDGIKVSWNAVGGAPLYRVYRMNGSSWYHCGYTTAASFTDTDVAAGENYTYTVRVCSADKRTMLSFYDKAGVSGAYYPAPQITSFSPVSNGTRVSWSASPGAAKYRLFVRNTTGSGRAWLAVGDTAGLYLDHKNLASGVTYTYTIRALNQKGQYISGFDPAGWDRLYLDAPVIHSVTKIEQGICLTWDEIDGAAKYRVYRKDFGGAWEVIGDCRSALYIDAKAQEDTLYAYTVRCVGADNKLASFYINESRYYINGEPANGTYIIDGKELPFEDGYLRRGYITISGKTYYYNANGEMEKNGLVGTKSEGFRYADANGVVDMNYTGVVKNSKGYWYVNKGLLDFTMRDAITWGGKDWNILNGKAYVVSDEEGRTLYRAMKLLNKVVKDRSLPKAKKLKLMWDYCKDAYVEKNPRIPHYKGMDWPIIYANDMLVNGVGNCLSYAAEYCFLAKAIGYEEVYACHSGGHGWAEIDGLVYDVEWARHNFNYSYYALSYDTKTDQNYKAAIAPGYAWMHVKVCAKY
jgi:fibronectin type 3 domain-containing protein